MSHLTEGMEAMKGLSRKEYAEIKDSIDSCIRPLIFYHDDADGLSSFLQIYRYKQDGRGIIIKSTPCVDMKFLNKVLEYSPDMIFVVDIADIEQEFIDSVKVPIVWVDHHGPYERAGVRYFNPRKHNPTSNPPVSYLMSKALKVKEDDWIAMAGMVGDWYLPPDHEVFSRKYPDLLPGTITRPEDAMFSSGIGVISEIFNFILKGTTSDALKHAKVMTRIKTPQEILAQETSRGKFIYKRYEYIKSLYEATLKEAKKKAGKGHILLYNYTDQKMSFTGELSNNLLYLYPEKVIIVAREKSGEMKCSFRSTRVILPPVIASCLEDLGGRSGGHEHACGAVIRCSDFKVFMQRFRREIKAILAQPK